MNLNELDLTATTSATVIDSERITPHDADEVRHIRLGIDDPAFSYQEGQSLAVLVPEPPDAGGGRHARLYSIAGGREHPQGHRLEISICVRRCFSVDEATGERRPGMASSYLCDVQPGQTLSICGPYGRPFLPPRDPSCNLLMIGAGTGMPPFRAFLENLHRRHRAWQGEVRLYYGEATGLDRVYRNDLQHDLSQYYRESTYQLFASLSATPVPDAGSGDERGLAQNVEEAWRLMQDPKTYVFVAGLTGVAQALDDTLARKAGSVDRWQELKLMLLHQRRWTQILYA